MSLSQHGPAGEPAPGIGVGEGGFDKTGTLQQYVDAYGCGTLLETGLYQGRGSGQAISECLYLAIDYQRENLEAADRIRPDGNYFLGDSATVLPEILADPLLAFRFPMLFWLDAHAISDDEGAPTVCPVLAELAAITGWEHAAETVVLIDDLWAMGTIRGWPTLDELREAADSAGVWERSEEAGIMRLTPRRSGSAPAASSAAGLAADGADQPSP